MSEKLYKLKDECKAFYTPKYKYFEEQHTLEFWLKEGYIQEALEEVPQRVELVVLSESSYNLVVIKCPYTPFTEQERLLMEQALNGELFTKDDLHSFASHYCDDDFDRLSKTYLLDEWLKTRKNA